jgi:hypothetical protein
MDFVHLRKVGFPLFRRVLTSRVHRETFLMWFWEATAAQNHKEECPVSGVHEFENNEGAFQHIEVTKNPLVKEFYIWKSSFLP